MKVVQINASASGSTGTIARSVHKRLLSAGEQSYVFYGHAYAHGTEENMYYIGNYVDLHAHSFLSRYLGKQGYFSHLPTLKLIRQLRKITPDIIHLHNLHGSYLNLPMLFDYLKHATCKVVITLHDCWLFTGKCTHFTVAGCYRWEEKCGHCSQLSSYPSSKIDTTAKCLADKKKWLEGIGGRLTIITVSNWLRDVARQSFLQRYRVDTIHNGVDVNIFYPVDGNAVRRKYGIGDKHLILGVSNYWVEQKGLGDFHRLSSMLADDEIIVLVGLNDSQISKLPPNIIGIKRTENQQELAELYSAADVLVNTSLEETFGMVTAESMACGTPVIVYDSTACAEIVTPQDGIILNSFQELRTAILTLKSAKAQQPHPGTPFTYTSESMVHNYVSLYKNLLS